MSLNGSDPRTYKKISNVVKTTDAQQEVSTSLIDTNTHDSTNQTNSVTSSNTSETSIDQTRSS
ncbi:hypothetical protein I4U23_002737 [Adineta vaga]|nr:hypothetical protein I4U23_002737 [Adineta vaga]